MLMHGTLKHGVRAIQGQETPKPAAAAYFSLMLHVQWFRLQLSGDH